MKLELKHLVPYFDYYLECIILETNERVLLESMNNDLHYQSYSFSSLNGSAKAENALLLEEHFKPILRPLSDLIKNKFYDGVENHNINWWKLKIKAGILISLDYESIQYLLKEHFDIFGLIEKGLAIDINILNK